tara:strand:+ start:309 stop:500 length:192 start_codon:yes stop_codon:yes gene_type:complete
MYNHYIKVVGAEAPPPNYVKLSVLFKDPIDDTYSDKANQPGRTETSYQSTDVPNHIDWDKGYV